MSMTPLPCPCCGSGAELRQVPDEDTENPGGVYVECIVCGLSTDLSFSIMDDARPKQIEKWNRRVPTSATVAAAAAGAVEEFGVEAAKGLRVAAEGALLRPSADALAIAAGGVEMMARDRAAAIRARGET